MTAKTSIFAFEDYRLFLRAWIESRSAERGLLTRICRALECQNAHLTRALQQKVHLTMDQAYRLCRFLSLSKAESRYFMKMTERDRAADPDYRRQLLGEMDAIKRAQENFGKRHQLNSLGDARKEALYYSSWHWVALHFITGIERYSDTKAIARRLGLEEAFVEQSLQVLREFGLVDRSGDRWTLSTSSIHLPKSSPMNSVQHGNWRQRAVLDSQDTASEGLHYTVVQAISRADFARLKQQFLEAIDAYRQVADPSSSEELVCFTLDFFRA